MLAPGRKPGVDERKEPEPRRGDTELPWRRSGALPSNEAVRLQVPPRTGSGVFLVDTPGSRPGLNSAAPPALSLVLLEPLLDP
jgi:hypothetical protein